MEIAVAGLGLIGGSAAKALARAGYACDGYDLPEVVRRAVGEGVVRARAESFEAYDVVLIALPPDAAMRLLDTGAFRQGAVVADFCGVKGALEACVCAAPRAYRYVGCHPMAGREVSGLENSLATLFDGASMIVCENEKTDADAVRLLEKLFADMGFANMPHCSAAYHDRKIAYTSQLRTSCPTRMSKARRRTGFRGSRAAAFRT